MRVSDVGVKIYNLTAGRSFPSWLSQDQRRKLSKDDDYNNHVMLLQDFSMPAASNLIRLTRDRKHLLVTGVYPPQIKCYQLDELSCKWSRHMEHETVAMEILTDDFAKIAYLGVDRWLTFHAKYGDYHSARVPIIGRDMAYDRATCDLFVVGSSNEIWTLNLEGGRFLTPIVTEFESINVMAINPHHSLLAFGGVDGVVECRDPRAPARQPLARLDVAAQLRATGESVSVVEISALEMDADGLHFGVGTSSGHALLYDLRSRTPLFQKDHRNELPIHTIRFASSSPDRMLSADSKVIKFWNKKEATSFANLETDAPSNDVLVFPDSGLIMATGERERVMAFYCPSLGKAPRWCSFLDNVTEELEERKIVGNDEIYEDYKFLTREGVAQIGAEALIGTPYLRAYMHGYFISTKLYKQMRAVANPNAHSEYRKERVEEEVAKARESRIGPADDDRFRALHTDARFQKEERGGRRDEGNDAIKEGFREVPKERRRRGDVKDGDDAAGGDDGVRMYEKREGDLLRGADADDDALFGSGNSKDRKKQRSGKATIGELAEQKARQRKGPDSARNKNELSFLPKEVVEAKRRQEAEKRQRMEHNKGRRKASTFLLRKPGGKK